MHKLDFHGCVPNRMKLLPFLNKFNVEPTEIHYDIEMSWSDYEREHQRAKDKGRLYDRWFEENRDWIKPIVAEVAKRDYKVKII